MLVSGNVLNDSLFFGETSKDIFNLEDLGKIPPVGMENRSNHGVLMENNMLPSLKITTRTLKSMELKDVCCCLGARPLCQMFANFGICYHENLCPQPSRKHKKKNTPQIKGFDIS